MAMGLYKLVENEPVECANVVEFAAAMDAGHADMSWQIGKTHVGAKFVSTVFLGIDHGFGQRGGAVLFETMIFIGNDGRTERGCWRYCTRAEALAGHARVVACLEKGEAP